jgi:VWFA-related protein
MLRQRFHVRLAGALALGLVVGVVLTAQQEPPPVRIDVIATDATGRFARDLQLADFEVLEGSVGRPLTAAHLVTADGALDPGETAAPIDSAAAEQFQAAREGTRLFAIFLDEYHVSAGAEARVRDAVTTLLDRLGPRDLILLAKPLDSLVTLRMTRDRDAARRAVAAFEGRKGNFEARSAFERSLVAGSAARNQAVRAQVVTSALNALAMHLGSLNAGRKALVFVSEGFSRVQRRRGEGPLPTFDAVVRAANRANVAIYSLDPRVDGPGPGEPAEDREMLAALASETSGRMAAASDSAAMDLIVRETSAYYLLTLASPADGKFHPIDVRVRKPGLHLRARNGFWAPAADDLLRARLTTGAVRPPPELPRRASPLIRPWFGVSRATDGSTRVSFVWEPTGRVPGDRSRAIAPSRIVLKASTADGTTVYEGAARASLPGMPAQGGAATPAQLVFSAPPGRLRVQMSIEDIGSRVLDTDVRDVAVRAFDGPNARVALGTPRIMRARTAREYRTLVDDPDAVPTPSRVFSRMERLLIRLPAYASADRPAVSARLLSAIGGAMRELTVSPATAPDVYQMDVPLSGLATGEYSIELVAASGDATAKELVAFRVTP